jgi:hypothetical protein
MKPWIPTEDESKAMAEALVAARTVQTFLWGAANGAWGVEEWRRMFRKRVAKIESISPDNPHAGVELRKRLLQTAALSIALIGIIDRDGVPWESSPNAPPSHLPTFSEPVSEKRPDPVSGHCCSCGYTGQKETECPNREDRVHCEHWWFYPG